MVNFRHSRATAEPAGIAGNIAVRTVRLASLIRLEKKTKHLKVYCHCCVLFTSPNTNVQKYVCVCWPPWKQWEVLESDLSSFQSSQQPSWLVECWPKIMIGGVLIICWKGNSIKSKWFLKMPSIPLNLQDTWLSWLKPCLPWLRRWSSSSQEWLWQHKVDKNTEAESVLHIWGKYMKRFSKKVFSWPGKCF